MTGGSSGYRVEALFDNAGFAVPGEEVRIAGAPVGTISALSVTKQNLAAVTLSIANRDFTPWYANATCTIRPQSLIAERYVDCDPGSSSHRALRRITSGYGKGSYLLPVSRTSSPIDPDIVQDISQDSVRESLSVILNELGTGLAARGSDLNAVILRADPALAQTERVFNLLDSQNRVLAKLATDSDKVLAPLAKSRSSLSDFVVQANTTATASAAESSRMLTVDQAAAALPQGAQAADGRPRPAGEPGHAGGQGRGLERRRARHRIQDAGPVRQGGQDGADQPRQRRAAVRELAGRPHSALADQLRSRRHHLRAVVAGADKLLSSLNSSGGIQQLMSLLFYGVDATNGYNADGHYVRVAPVVGPCTAYARAHDRRLQRQLQRRQLGVGGGRQRGSQRVSWDRSHPHRSVGQAAPLGGLLRYLTGSQS